MANRLMRPDNDQFIVAPSDPQQRVTFWLEHGNQRLREIGKHHLCWVWRNGSYSIEERD